MCGCDHLALWNAFYPNYAPDCSYGLYLPGSLSSLPRNRHVPTDIVSPYILFFQFVHVEAYAPQELLWKYPNGKKPDFYCTYINTEVTLASWNSWNLPSYLDVSRTLVDLWITCAACDQQHEGTPSLAPPYEGTYSLLLKSMYHFNMLKIIWS